MPRGAKTPRPPTRAGRIAIVGRPNVGKSTLLNGLIGEPIAIVSHHPQTTRDKVLGVVTSLDTQFVFIDTPGIHRAKTKLGARMNRESHDALEGADVILFVTDIGSDTEIRDVDRTLLKGLPGRVPIVLILNKIDRLASKGLLLPLLEAYAKVHDFAAIVPLSARRESEARRVLEAIRPLMVESPPLFLDDSISDRPTRFFVTEFVREQVLRKTREEVPHGVAVVVERFDEAPKVPIIELVLVVDKESHKKIVIGHRGSLLKEIGTDARARVEALLGKQVHLKIWVRVIPRWYENEAKMRELGYGEES